LKYWPSTRPQVSNFVGISPDFHGTIEAYLLCLGAPELGCTPAIIQQEYESLFVNTLRLNGGDSAYVPTTSIYSSTDEIVQPQSGTSASGYMNDERGEGVSNTDVQAVCPGQPAGGIVTHEGLLYNPLAYALAVDALQNWGPGSLDRIDVAEVCSQIVAPGLGLDDLLSTESKFDFCSSEVVFD
jgi:hypothetical protein